MHTSVLTSKGQLLIPKRMRSKYGIIPGSRVVLEETEEGVLVRAVDKKLFKKFRGILSSGNLKEELKLVRNEEDKMEERKIRLFKTTKPKK